MQQDTNDQRLVWRLNRLRRYSLQLQANLRDASHRLREIRVRRAKPDAYLPALQAQEKVWTDTMTAISGAMVECGRAAVDLCRFIDAATTVQQRADLIGAGRRGKPLTPDMAFATMLGLAMEQPCDRKLRETAGPLFIAVTAYLATVSREPYPSSTRRSIAPGERHGRRKCRARHRRRC